MQLRPRLSVCIATYNEEQNISRCIQSVYEWVNEIIIVDGTSTDKTREIALAFGEKIKISIVPNEPMFHNMKQKALEYASGEWVLQLDADEEITSELKREIISLFQGSINAKELKNETVAYWIPRRNFFLGRGLMKGGQYPDYTIRLYKNGAAHFPCKSVHEQVETISNTVGFLKHPMNHYPYPTFSEYLKKWDRYSQLEATLLMKKKVIPSFIMGINYFLIQTPSWFFLSYIRHRGYTDGFAGFVFALFSSLRFWLIYILLYEQYYAKKNN